MSRDKSIEMFWVMCLGMGLVAGCVARMLALEVSPFTILCTLLSGIAILIFGQIARDEWVSLS